MSTDHFLKVKEHIVITITTDHKSSLQDDLAYAAVLPEDLRETVKTLAAQQYRAGTPEHQAFLNGAGIVFSKYSAYMEETDNDPMDAPRPHIVDMATAHEDSDFDDIALWIVEHYPEDSSVAQIGDVLHIENEKLYMGDTVALLSDGTFVIYPEKQARLF